MVRRIESALHWFGYEHIHRPFSDFIDIKKTLKAAKEAGLSVSDYLEHRTTTSNRTPLNQTMDEMTEAGVFEGTLRQVCEIGPGSGRYLEKTLSHCDPETYEIYETSPEWRDWLVERYPVTAKNGDGHSLAETATESTDLVQAHKVFVGLPALVTLAYLGEMARAVRPGGWIVFDTMTEECFNPTNLQAWFNVSPWKWDWSPEMVARKYLLELFGKSGISLVRSFFVPLHPAVTECLIFRKAKTSVH